MRFLREEIEIHPSKIDSYLLKIDHPTGGSKARLLFLFGFDKRQSEILFDSIYEQAISHEVCAVVSTLFGEKYLVEGSMNTPSGRKLSIRTVWRKEINEEIIKFVTLYPI